MAELGDGQHWWEGPRGRTWGEGAGDPRGWVWGGGAGYFREGSKSPEGAGVLCLRIETM